MAEHWGEMERGGSDRANGARLKRCRAGGRWTQAGATLLVLTGSLVAAISPFTPLTAADSDAADVLGQVQPAVLAAEAVNGAGEILARGTGFAIEPGVIAVPLAVVRRGERVLLTRPNGESVVAAGVLVQDARSQIALVAVPAEGSPNPLPIDEAAAKAGARVLLIGHTSSHELAVAEALVGSIERSGAGGMESLRTETGLPTGADHCVWVNGDGKLVGWSLARSGRSGSDPPVQRAAAVKSLKKLLKEKRPAAPLTLGAAQQQLATATREWATIVPARRGAKPPQGNDPFRHDVVFRGPRPGDPFLLGQYATDAGWEVAEGTLRAAAGKNASVRLTTAIDFELEGRCTAQGTGGWFFLLGWDGQNGWLIYNVTLKTSGSPWLVAQLRNGEAVEESHREVSRHDWTGAQPFRLHVRPNAEGIRTATLMVGEARIVDDVPLGDYYVGDVIVGTYQTRYGPKPVQMHALRVRGVPAPAKARPAPATTPVPVSTP